MAVDLSFGMSVGNPSGNVGTTIVHIQMDSVNIYVDSAHIPLVYMGSVNIKQGLNEEIWL